MTTVEKRWPGETFVCIASGPSLRPEDVNLVRGRARVIVVNTSYQLAPWADVLYACDEKWWNWHKGVPDFQGLKFGLDRIEKRKPVPFHKLPSVQVLQNTGAEGLELSPHGLRHGKNSGYQAINLAVHLGAARILLLGYDMKCGKHGELHWHPDHPHRTSLDVNNWLRYYATLVQPLQALKIEVLNCTSRSALRCFPMVSLREALDVSAAA